MKLRNRFERCYLDSLNEYRFFYDDVSVYGCPENPSHVLYFIPGLNGVAGQARFALPGIQRVLGNRFYMRCLHLPEFSSSVPVWSKYTGVNMDKRAQAIRSDLEEMAARHDHIIVVASSTGFYEFAAVCGPLGSQVRQSITLLWVAAAPDHINPAAWETLFQPLNGIERNGYDWIALPNCNVLSFLNRETRSTFRWNTSLGNQTLYKNNLESRFSMLGISWGYFSRECTNWVFQHSISRIHEPLGIRAFVLAAEYDGYWQGMPKSARTEVIRKYLTKSEILWRKTSHLWVNTPENISAALSLAVGNA
jgi:hypothetical protein